MSTAAIVAIALAAIVAIALAAVAAVVLLLRAAIGPDPDPAPPEGRDVDSPAAEKARPN